MRGVQLPLSDELKEAPWGSPSANRGLKYAEDSLTFVSKYPINSRFTGEKLGETIRQVLPDWFKEQPDLTISQAIDRINAGGRHPSLADRKFRIHYDKRSGWYKVSTFLQILATVDLTEDSAKYAENRGTFIDGLLQDAEDEIKNLPQATQKQLSFAYEKYHVGFLDVTRQLQQDVTLAITDVVGAPRLLEPEEENSRKKKG